MKKPRHAPLPRVPAADRVPTCVVLVWLVCLLLPFVAGWWRRRR